MKIGKRAEFKKKSGRYEKKKTRVIEKYSILMLIATLLMSIGYAELTPVAMSVTADITAEAQEGVFITNIVATGNSGANMSASKVNSYISSRMDTTVVLGSSSTSTLTYTVSLMNRYDTEQVFVGTFWTQDAGGKYDNTKITYDVSMQEGVTTIQPGQSMNFTITFKYAGSDVSNKTLNSLLNFRFEEAPKIEFSAATTPINLSNIYPDYTPAAQTFTVKSVAGNGVPVKYTLSASVPKPFKAVIYNSSSAVVANNTEITMIPNANKAEIVHTYTMKIFWDNTNAENGTAYNNYTYAGKSYTGTINFNATPLDKTNTSVVDSKYNGLTIAKTGNIGITTAPLHLAATASSTSIEMSSNQAAFTLTVKNNNGTTYNPYVTSYKVTTNSNLFTMYIGGTEVGASGYTSTLANAKTDTPLSVVLKPKSGVTLGASQTCAITIQAVGPYVNKPAETITITAKDTTAPTKPTITGGNTNTTYAKSVTIRVSGASTDGGSGVAYYEYYKSSSSTAPTANTTGIQLGG